MSKNKKITVHDKAIRLAEGGQVVCDGHYVKVKKLPKDICSCCWCKMDSICRENMLELCCETFSIMKCDMCLELVNQQEYDI